MPKPKELRKVIKILFKHDIKFTYSKKGKHRGRFYKGNALFPVKSHGKKTELLSYALKGLVKKFNLPKNTFD